MSKPESTARKRALVTGSSRGIGRGIALQLAEDGMDVAIHYFQNRSAAEATLQEVRKRGADGFLIQADVRHMEEVSQLL
jgi:NAD(P)-dependent dehydrogenase (short-subunit alcohol dehydrogenase family)